MKRRTVQIILLACALVFVLASVIIILFLQHKEQSKTVEIEVFVISGKLVPTNVFLLETPNDACDFHHFLSKYPVIYSIDYEVTENPDPLGCEYGLMKDTEPLSSFITELQWRKYQELYDR